MNYGKYIVVGNGNSGSEIPIMFPSFVNHNDVANGMGGKAISAGFFEAFANPTEKDEKDIDVHVFGKSTTLKLKPKEIDSFLIKRVLRPNNPFA